MTSSIGGSGGSAPTQGLGGGDDKNVSSQKGVLKTSGGDHSVSKSGGQSATGTMGKVKQMAAMFEQGGVLTQSISLSQPRAPLDSNIKARQKSVNDNVKSRGTEDDLVQSESGTIDSTKSDSSNVKPPSGETSRVRSGSSSSSVSIDSTKSDSSNVKFPSGETFRVRSGSSSSSASIDSTKSNSSSSSKGPANISASNFKAGTRMGKAKESIGKTKESVGEAVRGVKTKVALSGEKMKWAVKDSVAAVKSKASSMASSSREACLHNCRMIKGNLVAKLGLTRIRKQSTTSQILKNKMKASWDSFKSGLTNVKMKLQGLRAKATANNDPDLRNEIVQLGEGIDFDPVEEPIYEIPEGTVELVNDFAASLQKLREDLEAIERRRQQ